MIIDLDPMHFTLLKPQASQAGAVLTCKQALALLQGGPAKTCLNAQGFTIACAGLTELWPGRGMAWAIFGASIRYNMPEIVREMRRMIDASSFHRVEMYLTAGRRSVDVRLAGMLGFRYECTAVQFLPNRNDADVYIWTRPSSPIKHPPRSAQPLLCPQAAVQP